MWLPGLIKLFIWRMNRLWRNGAPPEEQAKVAASYVRLRPKDPRGWALQGNALIRADRFEEGEQVLRRGLALHPGSDPDLGWLLARALTNQSRFDEARTLLAQQAETFSESRLPSLGFAEVALRQRRVNEALTFLDEALARTGGVDHAGKWEAAVLLALIPAGRDRAEILLREIIDARPNHAQSHELFGSLLRRRGDPKSTQHLDRARALWKSPIDFDKFVEESTRALGNFERDPHGGGSADQPGTADVEKG